ncbi:MAG: hypothetical protein JSU80_06270, partial [Deltaproteobacteria bacterium]
IQTNLIIWIYFLSESRFDNNNQKAEPAGHGLNSLSGARHKAQGTRKIVKVVYRLPREAP